MFPGLDSHQVVVVSGKRFKQLTVQSQSRFMDIGVIELMKYDIDIYIYIYIIYIYNNILINVL